MDAGARQAAGARRVARFEGSALVGFWAPWCGFCEMLEPAIEEIAAESPAFKVRKVNVGDEPGLAERFGVMALPALIAFKGARRRAGWWGIAPGARRSP